MAAFSLVLTYSATDAIWGAGLAAELRALGNDVWDAAAEHVDSQAEATREIQRRGLVLVVLSPESSESAALHVQIQFSLVVGARVYPVERGTTPLSGLLEVRQAIKVSNLDVAGAARLIEERLLHELSREVGDRRPDAMERGVAARFYPSLSGSDLLDAGAGPMYRAEEQGLSHAGSLPSHFLRFHSRQAWTLFAIWFSCFAAPFVVVGASLALQSKVPAVATFLARTQTWPAPSLAVRCLLGLATLCYLSLGILLPLRATAAGRALALMGRTLGVPVIGPWVERRVAAETRALLASGGVRRGRRVLGEDSSRQRRGVRPHFEWRGYGPSLPQHPDVALRRAANPRISASPPGPAFALRQDAWSALTRDKGLLFVSHADTDDAWCQALARMLYQTGYGVWSEHTPSAVSTVSLARHQEALQRCSGMLLVLSPEAWRTPLVQEDMQLAFVLHRPMVSLLRQPTDVSGFVLTQPWLDVAFASGTDAGHMLLDKLPGLLATRAVEPPPSGAAQRERAAQLYSAYSPLGPWHALKTEHTGRFVRFHAAQAFVVKMFRLAQALWALLFGLTLAPLVIPRIHEALLAAMGSTAGNIFFRADIVLAVIFGCVFALAVIPWWWFMNFQVEAVQRRILVAQDTDGFYKLRDAHGRMWLAAPVADLMLRASTKTGDRL